jgi:nucleotide-binding universal stress UspA family protein
MRIKDILVHVDLTPATEDRLALAGDLARRFEARLVGIGLADDLPAQEQFMALLDKAKLTGEWQSAIGEIGAFVTRCARAADLIVLGQPDPDIPPDLDHPEDVILGCGRPVLVAPYQWRFLGPIGEIVLVAWNGSREATRALHDGLPLMARAAAVTLFSVDPEPDDDWLLGGAVVRHLARHGLEAIDEKVWPQGLVASEAVLSRIVDVHADLLVMGAYGHSRLRETILGGMTRDILQRMKVPVLMAH